jgi:hypothetical protein
MSNITTTKREGVIFLAEVSRVILILILVIIVFGGGLYIGNFLTRRAIFKVIEIFYQHKALGINGAKTLHQLGLERPDFLQRVRGLRDYKQNALQILIKRGIIFENEDGRLYMVEEKLDEHLRSKKRQTDGY